MTNDTLPTLEGSASPFLAHGAEQPVAWMPWGPEAFDRARREARPVLLDIGAVWCHWCHVMDRESYEDPQTAELINTLFVPVKVDRDERPDVDARYQRAVQALSGQGGWPLTAFLTPEGETFYGGTYFPPVDAHGRPSFRKVLEEIARVWREEPSRAQEAAGQLKERLRSFEAESAAAGEVGPRLVEHGEEAFAEEFDFRHGGFGGAPKFPNAGALLLLLGRWLEDGADWKLRVVSETLFAMGRGGIYDQLGGGFHRYAVDARWRVPHFEKMAYDNGPLLEVYASAHAATGEPFFRQVAEGILIYYADIAPDLLARGGFPASQDADIDADDDGAHWTWTQEEMRQALDGDTELLRAAVLRYGVEDPASALHSDPSRKVLHLARSVEEVAERLELPADQARQRLEEVARSLKGAREERPRPYVDESLYAGWVALVASGFLAAGRWLAREDAVEAALRALERVWDEAFAEGEGIRHRVGDAGSEPLLEDQAYVAQALLDAFELTQEAEHLERARTLAELLLSRFRDADSGAFADRPADRAPEAAPLGRAHRPITDSPTPAPNAVAALVLLRLHALTHEERWRDAALVALEAFGRAAERMPTAMATYLRAVDWATAPVTTVVIVGEEDDEAADAMLAAALAAARPRMAVRRFAPGAVDQDALPPALAAMIGAEAPRAYVCVGTSCSPPTADAGDLTRLLEGSA